MRLRFGRHTLNTSHDDKVLFPDAGWKKADVLAYYRDVAELMLPHLDGRFLTLHRFPDGISADGFYQQRRSDHFPTFIRGRRAPMASGAESINHIVVENTAGLIYLADQATIAFHGWLSRTESVRRPDRMVFDLDPSEGGFRRVVDAALLLRDVVEAAGLEPHVMTTGSRGMHVVAPLDRSLGFDEVRTLATRLAGSVVARHPRRFTLEQRIEKRKGRLYLDVSRNAYGQTAVLPYSLRALAEAPVATPLDWDELGRSTLAPRKYHLGNIRRRLGQKEDPWRRFFQRGRRPADGGTE